MDRVARHCEALRCKSYDTLVSVLWHYIAGATAIDHRLEAVPGSGAVQRNSVAMHEHRAGAVLATMPVSDPTAVAKVERACGAKLPSRELTRAVTGWAPKTGGHPLMDAQSRHAS